MFLDLNTNISDNSMIQVAMEEGTSVSHSASLDKT